LHPIPSISSAKVKTIIKCEHFVKHVMNGITKIFNINKIGNNAQKRMPVKTKTKTVYG